MAKKYIGIHLRMNWLVKDSVDRAYRAILLEREEAGDKGKYSLNKFFNECLWDWMESEKGRHFLKVYSDRIYEKDKAERIARESKRKEDVLTEDDF